MKLDPNLAISMHPLTSQMISVLSQFERVVSAEPKTHYNKEEVLAVTQENIAFLKLDCEQGRTFLESHTYTLNLVMVQCLVGIGTQEKRDLQHQAKLLIERIKTGEKF